MANNKVNITRSNQMINNLPILIPISVERIKGMLAEKKMMDDTDTTAITND